MLNAHDGVDVLQLLPVLSRTATANGTGINVVPYSGKMKAVLVAAAALAGTAPTLDVKLQESDDNSSFADIAGASFTQVTNAASKQELGIIIDERKKYIRAVCTIGGTSTPTFAFGVLLVGGKTEV